MKPGWSLVLSSVALGVSVIGCGSSDADSSLLSGEHATSGGSGNGAGDGTAVSTDGGPVPGQPAQLVDGGANPLYCPTGLTECNAACADLTSSKDNCGACGVTCDGTCTASRCIVTLASGGNGQAIAVSATDVYFSSATGLMSVPIAGGTTTTLALNANGPIAVDAKNIYYSTANGVLSVLLTGGTPKRLGTYAAAGITSNAEGVCWTAVNGDVVSVPIPIDSAALPTDAGTDGGEPDAGTEKVAPPTTLSISEDFPSGIVAGASALYWATSGTLASGGGFTPQSGAVMRFAFADAPTDGGLPGDAGLTSIATGQNYPLAIALDSANVYWTASGTSANSYADGMVMKAPALGGTPVALASAQSFPYGIASDATNVYWANNGSGGTTGAILSVPIAGGTAATIADGLTAPTYIAVDATSIYWTTSAGAVMKATPK